MVLSDDLRQAVLQYAVTGKLVNSKSESSALELISMIQSELIAEGRIKKGTALDVVYDELPDGWIGLRIKDIVLRDVSYGIVKLGDEDREHGVSVLRCSDVKPGYIISDGIRTVTQELSQQYSRTVLTGGEIVINVRGTLGGCAIVPDEMAGYNIAREVAMIAVPNCLNKEYILLCLLSPMFWSYMQGNLRGIAYKGLNIKLLKDFILPIPPLAMQQEIVEKVNDALRLIDEYAKYEQQLSTLVEAFPGDLKSSILQDALQGKLTEREDTDTSPTQIVDYISSVRGKKVKPQENISDIYTYPEEWVLLKIIDATELYTGNSIPETVKATKYMGLTEGYNYIGTKDVNTDHTISYENGVKIPFDEAGFRYAEKDATLLCIEGGSAGKKIAILDEKVCFGNKLCAFNPIGINKRFLYYYLQSPMFLSAFSDKISGIIGGVSINKIKQMLIPVPSVEEQERIVNQLDKILPLCDLA